MFKNFIWSLKRKGNRKLIASIIEGYSSIFESVEGKHLVVVDIQPEYKDYFNFDSFKFINFLNENYEKFSNITFLYNGADTLGMISESDYKMWLIENGLEEEVLDYIDFYDKGYAFFRYCMDEGVDDEQISNLVKFMMENNINDSRDIDEDMWKAFVSQYGDEDLRDLMEHADDMIHIPDLIDEVKNYTNVVLTGGGINECLKEVEIAFSALNKPYSIFSEFTY